MSLERKPLPDGPAPGYPDKASFTAEKAAGAASVADKPPAQPGATPPPGDKPALPLPYPPIPVRTAGLPAPPRLEPPPKKEEKKTSFWTKLFGK